MSELNVSTSEVISILKKTLPYTSDKVKEVELVEKSKIKIVMSLSKLFPDISVILTFHSFANGLLRFSIASTYPAKIIQHFINNIEVEGIDENIFSLEEGLLLINIKEVIQHSIKWLDIKDVKMKNGIFTFTLTFDN